MSTVEEIVKAIKELSPEKRDEVRRELAAVAVEFAAVGTGS